jgi:hypothetical protein
VCFDHKRISRAAFYARERYLERNLKAEAALRTRPDTDGRGDGRFRRDLGTAFLQSHEFHGANLVIYLVAREKSFDVERQPRIEPTIQ